MLVLAGRPDGKNKRFASSLETYKYRDDIVLTGHVEEEELAKAIGAAYALVSPSLWEGFALPVLEAMRCDIPVITSDNSAMQEIAEDAALYVNPADNTDIADKMMLLYKDENLRSRLIQKGKIISDKYTWDKSAELLWKSIMKTAY